MYRCQAGHWFVSPLEEDGKAPVRDEPRVNGKKRPSADDLGPHRLH